MPVPIYVRDVQRLIGQFIALNRFMSKLAKRCLPFFKKLRRVPNFEWVGECQEAFDDLKRYLSSAHVLSSPLLGEELLIYFVTLKQAISVVLVSKEGGI